MDLSDETKDLIYAIEATAGKPLTRRNDMSLLIECAVRSQAMGSLDELSFQAKFAHRAFAIMQRIGADGEGYDKLSTEFAASVEKSKILINELLVAADEASKKKFESVLFSMSPLAFHDLLDLFYDLSWYKNYLIDSRKG